MDYLVSYGLLGEFGPFRADSSLHLRRGMRVVVRTPRGLEVGEILRPAGSRLSSFMPEQPVGTLVRSLSAEDERARHENVATAQRLLVRAEAIRQELNLSVELLDAEILFDGEHANILHLRQGNPDLRNLVRPLSHEFGLTITLTDLSAPVADDHEHAGCGDCGSGGGGCGSCGSGGGGCSSGSCGTSVSQEELQAHFAELRKHMEQRRVPLL